MVKGQEWTFPKIRGSLQGTILGSPIFGNPHMGLKNGNRFLYENSSGTYKGERTREENR